MADSENLTIKTDIHTMSIRTEPTDRHQTNEPNYDVNSEWSVLRVCVCVYMSVREREQYTWVIPYFVASEWNRYSLRIWPTYTITHISSESRILHSTPCTLSSAIRNTTSYYYYYIYYGWRAYILHTYSLANRTRKPARTGWVSQM